MGKDLLVSLDAVDAAVKQGRLTPKVLVVGQRTNVIYSRWRDRLEYAARGIGDNPFDFTAIDGELQDGSAEDFFLFRPGSIDWDDIPAFVIGRPGFDNFFVQAALDRRDVTVVDVSGTAPAIHVTAHGAKAGWRATPDKYWNYCALAEACEHNPNWADFCDTCSHCRHGFTDEARWETYRGSNGVAVRRKSGVFRACRDPRDSRGYTGRL